MLKENNPLLNLRLEKKKTFIFNYYQIISESIYSLYELLLLDPIENFYFECFHIFFGYGQLIVFIIDSTVSIIYIIILIDYLV